MVSLLLLAACSGGAPEETPTQEPAAPPSAVAGAQVDTPTPAPTETPVPPTPAAPGSPTPVPATPTQDAPAIAPTLKSLEPAPNDWAALEAWLAAAWREGRNPAAVRTALRAANWQATPDAWLGKDLDGDLQDEWILLLDDITFDEAEGLGPWFGAPGNLWVVNGDGVTYRHHDGVDLLSREPGLLPELAGVADLTGDGLPELIVMDLECGAHTCYGYVRVIGHVGGAMRNLVQTTIPESDWIEISFPEVRVQEVDGRPTLQVHGGTIGSVGAGIMRSYTEVWAWDGEAIRWQETVPDPTSYRHLILYEGINRMENGDLEGAVALFEEVILNPDLETMPFGSDDLPETEAAIRQFAVFRLVLAHLLLEDAGEAKAMATWLEQRDPGAPLTLATQRLVSEWAGSDGMDALCAAIQVDLEASAEPPGPLADQGYGNPSLTAEHICRLP
jgi:hypothetical protein